MILGYSSSDRRPNKSHLGEKAGCRKWVEQVLKGRSHFSKCEGSQEAGTVTSRK